MGWDDLDSAQAILDSPTNTHPMISYGKFVQGSK
jgi:hypothetical protein